MMSASHHSKSPRSQRSKHLVIGLVNNMPDGALHSTEEQFSGLLEAASQSVPTWLRYFFTPGIPRASQAQAYLSQNYADIDEIRQGQLDGLIVTGTEPRAPALEDEAYWRAFEDLVEQVNRNAIPTVWSCLAAHGAVLCMDGIHRRPLREKLSGIFECKRVVNHEIIRNAPSCWRVPHSRQNEVPEEELVSKGYMILSRSLEAGADIFVRDGTTLSIFLQGHLEYDPGALFREYRRDVRRFLSGERSCYPAMPSGYFDPETTAMMTAFQEQAIKRRSLDVLLRFPEPSPNLAWAWREVAVILYRNWLGYIAQLRN